MRDTIGVMMHHRTAAHHVAFAPKKAHATILHCGSWREGVRHELHLQPEGHRPAGLLCRARHPTTAALLSTCVAGASTPCRALLSPQPIDVTALSQKPPGWHGFCPCLLSPPRWCSSGRVWQHTPPPEPGGSSAGAKRTGRLPCRVSGICAGLGMACHTRRQL